MSAKNVSQNLKFSDTNRRTFLKTSSLTLASTGIATSLSGSWSQALLGSTTDDQEKTYLLEILIQGGLDSHYLFDCRPLEMASAKLMPAYGRLEPILYTGINGESLWASKAMDPLMKWRDRFSVLNGVIMSTNFVGHTENLRMLLTGNPFGGNSYVPERQDYKTPLGFVTNSNFLLEYANIRNGGSSIGIGPDQCKSLISKIGRLRDEKKPSKNFAAKRADLASRGSGSFSAAAKGELNAMGDMPSLARSFAGVSLTDFPASDDPSDKIVRSTLQNVDMASQMMRTGITKSAIIELFFGSIDTHDPDSAKKMPQVASDVAKSIAAIFDYLASTPSSGGRSMLDDTVVVISSEFSRTMRQEGLAIENTGTDHNPFTNSVIVAGKGVRGGQVFGMSDFRTSTEDLSKVHLGFDPQKLHAMGLPFDFSAGRSLPDLKPETFDPYQYLTINSVSNSIQKALGISKDHWFNQGRLTDTAPIVPNLFT